ncbi:MAG: hypothetical protein P1U38_14570 [Aeromicrobium sp.]|uniref:hypothetical protein n=1 Tax=Aeromicrobium sp. TaxID=1871063 RepID=UPI0026339D82|nr:hypothetical protein [Aeromicrobium sp.]MDF1705988.1 hypothetical protein [Aeromicrobium sp.]
MHPHRTAASVVAAVATAVQAVLLLAWSVRITTPSLTSGVVGLALVTASVALALAWRSTFEARLAALLIAAYALISGLLVMTIGLPTMPPDPVDPVALVSVVAAAAGFAALELDRRAQARRATLRRAQRTYA